MLVKECPKRHMALGEMCVTLGKWEKKGWKMSKTSDMIPVV